MKNIMQKAFINLFLVFLSVSVCGLFATDAKAYNRYNDGCQNCHGSFSDGFSPKGTPFDYHENNKQEMHRNPYAMATDCALCHTSGDKDNPYIGNSSGHQGDFDVGCVGCHGREEDAGNDSISPGRGAGLRQHHWNADVIVETESGPVSSQVCADCHTDTKPQQYTPVGEQVKPSYYGSDHTNADGPCNLIAQHETNENWDHYDFEGLDNDGDGLYDGNDPDCFPDTLTVVENVAPATNVEPGESGIEMQRLEVQCSNDGNGNCIIVSVSVNDTQISNEGVIDSLEVHIDDDMKMRNGTLGRVTISNWDGEPTVADMTSIPFEDRTLDNNNNNNNEKYIFLIYNLTASSDGSSIQSQVTAIDVASPDNGSSGTWSSNRITIGGPSCSDNDNDGYSPDGGSCGPLDCNDNDNAVHPAAQEVCDGLDNDCNGTADDITPQATTCGIGECSSTGQTTCIGGVEGDTCTPGTPSAEVCDNLDNDCDGAIDENLTRSTTCGIGECASSGEETCTAGTWGNDTCSPGTPGTEGPDGNVTCTDTLDNDCDGTTDGGDSDCTPTCVPTGVPETVCNDVDDDCDGQVDEDFTPTATSCGVGECSSTGQTTCVGGVEGDTCTPGTPSAELCDNLDNDCDGVVDDFTRSTTCGVGECGSTGVETCTAGVWGGDTCTPGAPSAELCDNLDNNCDGSIDENLTQPTSCGVGECSGNTGIETCTTGTWDNDTCDPFAGATAEVCDNLDNNCDGAVDENLTQATTCGVGECSGNTGTETCTAGTWGGDTCDPFGGANPEGPYGDLTCGDLSDNDCDGYTDTADSDCEVQCSDYTDKQSCNNDSNCKWDKQQEVCIDNPSGCTPAQEGPSGDATCSDGSDNDCDDLVDGNDPDCTQTEGNCFDGLDDDNDGLTDCVDSDCDGATGGSCTTGQPGICSTGTRTCQGGGEVCVPDNQPQAEVCDNLDNNCDGAIDDNLTRGTTCGQGECAGNTGVETCSAGAWGGDTCDPLAGSTPEGPQGNPTCTDTLDNDCDGTTDTGDSDCQGGGTPFDQLDDFTGLADGTRPNFGNWTGVNGSDNTMGWVVLSGSTGSSSTGPAAGNPDPYVYLESSGTGQTYGVGVTAGSSQYLLSNVIDASQFSSLSFSFDWNMNVDDNTDASLHVDVYNGSGWDHDVTGGAINTGDNGDVWVSEGPIDLSSYSNSDFQIRIRYVVGDEKIYRNDVAVDNLYISGTTSGGGECTDGETRSCGSGVGECVAGTETCVGSQWSGVCEGEIGPSAETCDNLDNNCDGAIDENVTRGTTCGQGECAGNSGIETCTAGTWGGDTCDPLAGASPEVCDDAGILDEDCDGLANGNDPECGCVPTGIPDNNCDGIDDDCDGQIDEDYVVEDTCGAGICQTNNTPSSCVSGVETQCQPGIATETPEATCNDGVDNDCDNAVDGADPDCGGTYIPPPVRQEIGVQDGLYNNLEEPDCRFCHEDDAGIPVEGRCSVANTVCFQDADCPVGETCDPTRIQDRHHILALTPEFIPNGSLIFTNPGSPTDPDTDNDGVADSFYACESCHPDDPGTPDVEFPVTRNCLLCHVQLAGTGSVHHLTPTAQGTDSPIGDPNVGDCTPCHGTIVDDTGDGHVIPAFDPTPETPKRSGGNGVPFNSRGNGTGACNYCHDDGISPEGILIETNMDTHHNTGLGPPVEDPVTSEKCAWCHDFALPFEAQIRICENCHGQESLHNVQADSDGDGVINPGIELPFYGHIGDPDDCWGCHGFGAAAVAPESGPVVPTISSISEPVLIEGTDTTVTLSGTAFTNMDEGTELTSDVVLIAADGSSTILIPDAISQDTITVTIPGTLAKGNYKLKTEKLDKYSNPKVISIKPSAVINSVNCKKKNGHITISGAGFGEKPQGTDAYLTVDVNGENVAITYWADTLIKGVVSSCPGDSDVITVNALFGSATW